MMHFKCVNLDNFSLSLMHSSDAKMKKLIPLTLTSIGLFLSSAVIGAPFMAVGDSAELFVTGTVGIRADDNVFLTANPLSDVIFDVNPGLDLTFGKNSQFKGSFTLVDSIAKYSDNSNLDTNLVATNFQSGFDDGKLKLNFNVGYNELNQNAADIRGLTRRDVFSAGAKGEVEISQITSVGAGVAFNQENYKRRTYSDSSSLTLPLDFFYKVTPKVDLSVGYRYRSYQVDIGEDSGDHFFNVGARGDFTPKLSGRVAVGLNTRQLERSGNENQFGLDANLNYEISPKTRLTLGAGNDFATSPQGQQQKNLTLNAALTFSLTQEWSANAGLNYRRIGYAARSDDYLEGQLGAAYIVNANIRIVGGYTYRNYSSVLAGSEFSNNVFSIGANLRY